MELSELDLRSCNPLFSKVFQTCLQVILCKKIFHHGHFFPTFVGPTTDLEEEYEPAFEEKSAVALKNADIQVDKQLRAART